MRMCNFDFVYKNLKSGLYTPEQAAKEVMTLVFLHPPLFGTAKLNEDERSEFLLFLYPVLVKLHISYEPDRAPYMAYMHLFIQLSLKSWRKSQIKKNSSEECYIQYYHSDFDTDEDGGILHEQENEYCSSPLEIYEDKAARRSDTENKKVFIKTLEKVKNMPVKDILILALKSCYYLQDRHIQYLSLHTGIQPDSLWNLKKNIEQTMTSRIDKSEKRCFSRNSSFYKRSKALLEMNRLDQNSICYSMLKKSFLYHDKYWKYKNTLRYRRNISPNNYDIASALNLQNYEIGLALRRAKKYAQILESM